MSRAGEAFRGRGLSQGLSFRLDPAGVTPALFLKVSIFITFTATTWLRPATF